MSADRLGRGGDPDARLAAWGAVDGQLALVPVDVPTDPASVESAAGDLGLFDVETVECAREIVS